MEASTGYSADFQTSQPWLLLASYLAFGIGGAIAALTLSARLVIRQSQNAVKCDDFLMLLAWALSVVAQAIFISAIRSSHPSSVLSCVIELARLSSHSLTKLSLAVLYLRIFPSRWQTRAGWAIFAAISAYTIAISGLLIHRAFKHTPVTLQLSLAATGAGIITDLLLVILPVPDLLLVRITPTERLMVLFLWCSPILATTTSSVRVYFLVGLPGSSGPAKDATIATMFLFIEVNLTIICGNMPAMHQATKRVKEKASSWIREATMSREGGSSQGSQGPDAFPLGGVMRSSISGNGSQLAIIQTDRSFP